MSSESDVLRLRDPSVLANRFGSPTGVGSRVVRLPAIRFETVRGSRVGRTLRCITPTHVLLFALAVAILTLAERLARPLHVVS